MPPPPRPAPPPVSRRRRWAFRGLAVALGVGLALALLEVGLRLGGYELDVGARRTRVVRASPRPWRRYELIPGVEGHAWLTPVKINALGGRGPAVPEAGRPRLALLGDSVGFGLFVAEEDSTAAGLRDALPGGAAVRNFSVTGYDCVQQLDQLEADVLPWGPDGVVLLYCLNDVGIGDEDMAWRDLADRLHNAGPSWSRAHHFVSHLVEVAGIVGHFVRANRLGPFTRRYAPFIDAIDPEEGAQLARMAAAETAHPVVADWYTHPARVGRLRGCLRRMKAAADAAGVPFLMAVYPLLPAGGPYPYDVLHEIVAAEAARAGVEVVDLRGAFAAVAPGERRVLPFDDIHPGPAGHAAAAAAIAGRLVESPAWAGFRAAAAGG